MSVRKPKARKVTRERKLRWMEGLLTSGKFAGPVWGAEHGGAFLMIVPRKGTDTTPAYYELWFAGIVYDETQSETLPEAQAFGEKVLREGIDGIVAGLAKLTAHAAKRAA